MSLHKAKGNMEHHPITQRATGLHIEGFPDAVKVLAIEGPRAKRLSDLALHRGDLEFSDECLNAINVTPEESSLIREALWRSAILHFLKCFGDSGARFQLAAEKILKGKPAEAAMAFDYFKGLRNKHIVHDENSCSQSIPGAILNSRDNDRKIEKIVCFSARAETLGQDNYSNLKLLIQKSRSWVISEFDSLCDTIAAELEAKSYDELLAKTALTYTSPQVKEVHEKRNFS